MHGYDSTQVCHCLEFPTLLADHQLPVLLSSYKTSDSCQLLHLYKHCMKLIKSTEKTSHSFIMASNTSLTGVQQLEAMVSSQ